jgi:hypothetical protein
MPGRSTVTGTPMINYVNNGGKTSLAFTGPVDTSSSGPAGRLDSIQPRGRRLSTGKPATQPVRLRAGSNRRAAQRSPLAP